MSGKSLQYSRALSHAYSYWWWMNKDSCVLHFFYFNYYLVHRLLYICLSGLNLLGLMLVGHMYQEFVFLLDFTDFWKYKFPKHSLMNLCFFFSSGTCLNLLFYISHSTNLDVLFILVIWLGICQSYIYFSKNQLFDWIYTLFFFSINFFHNLHYFLPSDAFLLEFVLFLQWLTGPLENVLFNLHLFV